MAFVGFGHVYQGRYKAFPVETNDDCYQVLRYVERNALRANLVDRAESWRYDSLCQREYGDAQHRSLLSTWPVPRPRNWNALVNQPQTEPEVEAIRRSLLRGQPYGSETWVRRTAEALGLESTMRRRGRPKKTDD